MMKSLFIALMSVFLFSSIQAAPKKYTIYMVLFNGKGNCEKGFTDYFRSRNIQVEYLIRDCGGEADTCPYGKFIQEIREIKPDLIYTWGTPGTVAISGAGKDDMSQYITDIPIISLPIANPVGSKFTSAIGAYTGRNLAGVSQMPPVEEQLKAIELYGNFKKLGAIYTPFEPNIVAIINQLKEYAKKRNFQFIAKPLPLLAEKKLDPTAVGALMRQMSKEKIDFLYIGPDTSILEFGGTIRDQAAKHKIPTFASSELTAQKINPLFGFFSRFYHVGQLAGYKAEKILMKKLPKEQLFTFETLKFMSYTINPKTGMRIGFTPPIALFKFAQIIE